MFRFMKGNKFDIVKIGKTEAKVLLADSNDLNKDLIIILDIGIVVNKIDNCSSNVHSFI